MKKILSVLLALIMVLACGTMIFADDAVVAENPVAEEETSAYYDAVEFLVSYDIMKGKGNGNLGVFDDIKRYEMALFMGRIMTGWTTDANWIEYGNDNKSEFNDLAGTPAVNYYGAISYVNQKGVVEGYGNGKYGPVDGIIYQDALTMATRSLGYKNLSYPWGYIEKAVNLGLTEGITDISYTEPLKREVVAQIVNNTLFAVNADGETLAKTNFGLDLSWETIVVVATDKAYVAGYETVKEGYVAYSLLNSYGALENQIYVTPCATLGFENDDDDEHAIGVPFKALFNKTDDGLGEILSYQKLELESVLNRGRNELVDGKYPVQSFLGDFSIVDRYSEYSYLTADENEMILGSSDGIKNIWLGAEYVVDWATGDILRLNDNGVYEIYYFYNKNLDRYFYYQTEVKDNNEVVLVGIYWVTEDELEFIIYDELNGEGRYYSDLGYGRIEGVATEANAVNAYATLRIFDLDADEVAEYGIYEEYRFGFITENDAVHCIPETILDPKNSAYYNEYISDVESGSASPRWNPYTADGWNRGWTNGKYTHAGWDIIDLSAAPAGIENVVVSVAAEGACEYSQGFFGTGFEPEMDGDKVLDNYVIYNYNESTGEIKILETIGEYDAESDNDSYVAYGVVRAFNVVNKTITIDDERFSYDYINLKGSITPTMTAEDDAVANAYCKTLFNQYVEYVVVDGRIAYIELEGEDTTNYMIVEGLAGISNDGYIIVWAWNTVDLKLNMYRIASYDGWTHGDYFYYSPVQEEEFDIAFSRGAVYKTVSYDPANDAYNVKVISNPEDDSLAYEGDYTQTSINYAAASIGRMNVSNTNLRDTIAQDAKNHYIIVMDTDLYEGISPILQYTGYVYSTNWKLSGKRIDTGNPNEYFFIDVKPEDINGFNSQPTVGIVMFQDYAYAAGYDAANGGDWYVKGMTQYTVYCTDVLHGLNPNLVVKGHDDITIACTAYSKNLKPGYLYYTVDGKILDDTKHYGNELPEMLRAVVGNTDIITVGLTRYEGTITLDKTDTFPGKSTNQYNPFDFTFCAKQLNLTISAASWGTATEFLYPYLLDSKGDHNVFVFTTGENESGTLAWLEIGDSKAGTLIRAEGNKNYAPRVNAMQLLTQTFGTAQSDARYRDAEGTFQYDLSGVEDNNVEMNYIVILDSTHPGNAGNGSSNSAVVYMFYVAD